MGVVDSFSSRNKEFYMMKWWVVLMVGMFASCVRAGELEKIVLDYDSAVDAGLQGKVEGLDVRLRAKYGMSEAQTAVGVMDLKTGRLALVRADREEYAASLAKIGILLAYFDAHREAGEKIDPTVERELGEMAKISSNEMASKYSHELGLKNIQKVLTEKYGFYDAKRGGGIWVGKHYGKGTERYGSPVGDNSHAATVRQVMRFFVMLEQGKLVSAAASKEMRKIFESPGLKHDDIKFVKGLAGRDVQIIRKWGTWEDWRHDAAVVTGGGRHYVIVGLTRHAKGDAYLEELARGVDDLMK
jgi:beta-lactamase class A